ncbi:MAG: pilus assembly protein [Thiogranum sp.]
MNTTKRQHNKPIISSAIAGILALCLLSNIMAAPGTLATSPLFLQSGSVQPNIFFMIDDSGSMNWEDLLNKGTYQSGAAILSSSTDYNPPGPYSAEWDRRLARLFCRGFNVMAYDPRATYTPWQGVDSAGKPYGNMTINSARSNPYTPGSTVNISGHYYWPWDDADGDNEYDGPNDAAWWGGDPVSATDECGDVSSLAAGVAVNSLPATGTPANPNSQRNYANWFTYYRKREYVAKRALSAIISDSTARAGLATINGTDSNSLTGDNNDIIAAISDIDDITTPVDSNAATNKEDLLESLFRIDSTGGTPLRRALERVGEYYEGNQTSWGPSPIQSAADGGECQQNFTILMSDGQWNGGDPNVGNTDTDGAGPFDGGLYADTFSDTLADVAMHYYETDLSSLADKVPVIAGVDNNNAQHMVTYTVAFGLSGNLDPNAQPGDTGFSWPQPVANQPTTIDDMRHAAYNGRGQFLSAENPQNLIDSLGQYISNIQERTGTAAAVSFNSTSLQAGTRIYQAIFNSNRWSGDLLAKDILINTTTGIATISGTAWAASDDIDSRTPASRQLITYNSTSGNGVDFTWSTLSPDQKDDLRTDSSGSLGDEASGMARLGYLRGDRSCEVAGPGTCSYPGGSDTVTDGSTFTSKTLRQRNSALGDIVHSSPFFVGPPATPYPDSIEPGSPYSAFAIANSTRAGITYVGSNDGMLHALDEDGDEVFGYFPASLFSTVANKGLHYLSDPNYVHSYYVDLSPTVQDAFIDTGSGTEAWHSILVGALRGGGKGLFAIDVTDPSDLASNAAGNVLWEFTHNDLGYTFSDIRIGKMNNGEWAAIFGNGYNNDPNGDGKAKLFIVYLDGSNASSPIVIDTGAGSIDSTSKDCGNAASDCNGLGTPRLVDLNGDGTIDRIYAGDLFGNMWVFNVEDKTSTANWQPAYGTSPAFQPLFQACSAVPCTTANRQPIMVEPDVASHPTKFAAATAPNLLVFFGTGQYLVQSDNASTQLQSFYGVWDSGTANLNRDSLQAQTITTTADATLGNVRTVTENTVPYSSSEKGWRIDLPTAGERSVTSPLAFGSIVFFNTVIPTSSSSNMCSVGGSGWLMAVDLLTGGAPVFAPIDVDNNGTFDAGDKLSTSIVVGTQSDGVPAESRFISNKRVTADSTGSVNIDNIRTSLPPSPARMSWSELKAP